MADKETLCKNTQKPATLKLLFADSGHSNAKDFFFLINQEPAFVDAFGNVLKRIVS